MTEHVTTPVWLGLVMAVAVTAGIIVVFIVVLGNRGRKRRSSHGEGSRHPHRSRRSSGRSRHRSHRRAEDPFEKL